MIWGMINPICNLFKHDTSYTNKWWCPGCWWMKVKYRLKGGRY